MNKQLNINDKYFRNILAKYNNPILFKYIDDNHIILRSFIEAKQLYKDNQVSKEEYKDYKKLQNYKILIFIIIMLVFIAIFIWCVAVIRYING